MRNDYIECWYCEGDAVLLAPTVWKLPPEPGPEVTAVRGHKRISGEEPESVLLKSAFNGGAWMGPTEAGGCFPYSWASALAFFGPLTDASDEMEE